MNYYVAILSRKYEYVKYKMNKNSKKFDICGKIFASGRKYRLKQRLNTNNWCILFHNIHCLVDIQTLAVLSDLPVFDGGVILFI